MLKIKWKKLLISFVAIYITFSLYVIYHFIKDTAPISLPNAKNQTLEVEIWGKAAIGLYLWEHILEGPLALDKQNGELLQYGEITIRNINFRFRTGPLLRPGTVENNAKHVVLIINGREPKKISFARTWLDLFRKLKHVNKVAVVLLGNERCDNTWFLSYLTRNGGPIKLAFIIYDIPNIDNKVIYQWPLGVATYRKFPNIGPNAIDLRRPRTYKCNFMGTVYKGSSRETLNQLINSRQDLKDVCFTKIRTEWHPNESKDSRNDYINILEDSDLTLCPIGINSECYRIYEAMSYGSVPVVEDVMTPGTCGKSSNISADTPFRILKEMEAPIIYIRNWEELINILQKETELTLEQVQKRRETVVQWYKKFKFKLRDRFVNIIYKKFI